MYTVIEKTENFVQKVFLRDMRFNYQAVLSVGEADLSGKSQLNKKGWQNPQNTAHNSGV